MAKSQSNEIVTCEGCGRDVHGGTYCAKCVGRGGRASAGDGFRGRQGWRDVRVIAGSEMPDGDNDDDTFLSELQWHGAE